MKKREMKKRFAMIMAVIVLLLTGCGGKETEKEDKKAPADEPVKKEEEKVEKKEEEKKETTLTIKFSNATAYIFNEISISPTASNEWGEELLGSTRVLKSDGTVEVEIPAYDYDTYDIRVVDEEKDEYLFSRVPLKNKAEVIISFTEEGLLAGVADENGEVINAIVGELYVQDSGTADDEIVQDSTENIENLENMMITTGADTSGVFEITVYNESSFDIYSIYLGLPSQGAEGDFDALTEILGVGEGADLTGQIEPEFWGETEWTLYIVDVDGDTSSSYETFNPWTISYIDITWDSDNGGYVCNFVY